MKNYFRFIYLISLLMMSVIAFAQKGMGEAQGVSRQGIDPEIMQFEGVVTEVKQGPCENTTGRSVEGTHLIIDIGKNENVNIHLGPSAEVSDVIKDIKGKQISLRVFRTDKLPENHYIAKEISLNEQVSVLRNDDLKPVWAGRTGKKGGKRKGGCCY